MSREVTLAMDLQRLAVKPRDRPIEEEGAHETSQETVKGGKERIKNRSKDFSLNIT